MATDTDTARTMTADQWRHWATYTRIANGEGLGLHSCAPMSAATLAKIARRTIGHARGLAVAVAS